MSTDVITVLLLTGSRRLVVTVNGLLKTSSSADASISRSSK